MNPLPFLAKAAVEAFPPWNVLEWSFIAVLVLALASAGAFGAVVIARTVEPRGVKALLRRISGKA